MKVSLHWLCDHIDLAGKSVAEIDEMLTFSGVEVEGVKNVPEQVVVAQILSSDKHPGADRLSVCQVDDGTGSPRQIVCGAKNYAVGDNVPLALPGCQMAPDFKIKSGKLRGEKSDGMLCSAMELGMEDEVDGLMILDPALAPGTPLTEIFPPVFDLEVTPNRPDCLSHLGIARELSVLSGNPLKGVRDHSDQSDLKKASAGVSISAPEACPLYTARMIRGVKVSESPAWLKSKLVAIGLRPINNIVDITNFVLMEMGQPLHAFDVSKLSGGIDVRWATEGESLIALDGETYELGTDDLVIADFEQALAIAGVMGGEESGVTESTVDVLLESAYFDPPGVRRTARRLGLSSDSSYRFERGVDPKQIQGASELATRLILELAGGKADDEILVAGEAPDLVGEIELDHGRVDQLMGTAIGDAEIERILGGLGLVKGDSAKENASVWTVPSYRLDLQRPVDLIEEIARVYGLDKVEGRREAHFVEIGAVDRFFDFTSNLSTRLTGQGYFEARTIKLVSSDQLADHLIPRESGGAPVPLKNPLTDDHTHLRPSVLPGLLAVAERNIRMGADRLRFFEIGTVFETVSEEGGEEELQSLGILLSGPEETASWAVPEPGQSDVFGLLGIVAALVPGVEITFEKAEIAGLVVGVDVYLGRGSRRVKVGGAGQVAPAKVREIGVRHPIYVAEIDLEKLHAAGESTDVKFEELQRFPAITRDVAMEAPMELENGKIEAFFRSQDVAILESFRVFDVFTDPTGEKLASDRKSLAYSLTYRSPLGTLQMPEVDTVHGEILEGLKKALPVSLREG